MPSQTNIASFVVRFVQETTDGIAEPPQAGWHGIIRHVQTNDEQHFARLADAIAFIARYVKLDEFPGIGGPEIRKSESRRFGIRLMPHRIPDNESPNPE